MVRLRSWGNAFVEQVANGSGVGQGDGIFLEAGRLLQAGEKDQAHFHGSTVPRLSAEADRSQSPDLPPLFVEQANV